MSATLLMRSASLTELPPNFCTINAITHSSLPPAWERAGHLSKNTPTQGCPKLLYAAKPPGATHSMTIWGALGGGGENLHPPAGDALFLQVGDAVAAKASAFSESIMAMMVGPGAADIGAKGAQLVAHAEHVIVVADEAGAGRAGGCGPARPPAGFAGSRKTGRRSSGRSGTSCTPRPPGSMFWAVPPGPPRFSARRGDHQGEADFLRHGHADAVDTLPLHGGGHQPPDWAGLVLSGWPSIWAARLIKSEWDRGLP